MLPLIVTAAVIRAGDRVLITRRPDGVRHGGLWEFPGGKLAPDETPEECLRREILEELDLVVSVGPIFEVAHYRYDLGPVLILAYQCTPAGGSIRNLHVAEHRWVHPQDLSRFAILPADQPIIAKLQA